MSTSVVPAKTYVHGSRPVHVHVCPGEGEIHRWDCNSPYCDDMSMECPTHGGPTPVIQGYEPWKGR